MSDSLLAPEANNQTDGEQSTTQSAPGVDTQAAPEQTTVEPQTTTADDTTKPTPPTPADKADDGKAADKAPEGAPEVYELEVPRGVPEGFEMDKDVIDSFKGVARELDLPQDKAQKLIDSVLPTIHRRAEEQQVAIHEKWTAEAKADKGLQDGKGFDDNVETAKRAVAAYGNDALRELLQGPLGSHPEVIRFMMEVGKTVSEDTFAGGGKPGDQSVGLDADEAAQAAKLYPNSP